MTYEGLEEREKELEALSLVVSAAEVRDARWEINKIGPRPRREKPRIATAQDAPYPEEHDANEEDGTHRVWIRETSLKDHVTGLDSAALISKGILITYEAHVRTCALARDPIQAASMASCNSFGQCWATVTRSRRRKPLG